MRRVVRRGRLSRNAQYTRCTRFPMFSRPALRERERNQLGYSSAANRQRDILLPVEHVRHGGSDRAPRQVHRGDLFAGGLVESDQPRTVVAAPSGQGVDQECLGDKRAGSATVSAQWGQVKITKQRMIADPVAVAHRLHPQMLARIEVDRCHPRVRGFEQRYPLP